MLRESRQACLSMGRDVEEIDGLRNAQNACFAMRMLTPTHCTHAWFLLAL